ncbi:hypothetical protein HK104_001640 [Borealophlyctis nickersoniae]|nr:hypothetical protein HK104_001640 [Borealophlyctis nickersoniae]
MGSDLDRFRDLVQRNEISYKMAGKLRILEGFDIVVIVDDSGSMSTPCTQPTRDPFAPKITRWDELKQAVKIIVEIGSTLDSDGVDLYFLNRPNLRNVRHPDQIDQSFFDPPRGYTPIARTLRQVLTDKRHVLTSDGSKKLLIIIATDGEPTDDVGNVNKQDLRRVLDYERRPIDSIHVTFVACTDDQNTMRYLNDWDKNVRHLDVVDDYFSERAEVLKAQGPGFPFSRGDWVCKILLGSIDPEVDALDERREDCCIIL